MLTETAWKAYQKPILHFDTLSINVISTMQLPVILPSTTVTQYAIKANYACHLDYSCLNAVRIWYKCFQWFPD